MADEKGQATIEALITSIFMISFVSLIVSLTYFSYLKSQIEFLTYEALICKIEVSNKGCLEKVKRQIQSSLPFGEIKNIYLTKSDQRVFLSFDLILLTILEKPFIHWSLKKEINKKWLE